MSPEQEKQYIDDAFSGKIPEKGTDEEREWNKRYFPTRKPPAEQSSKEVANALPTATDSSQLKMRLELLRAAERDHSNSTGRGLPADVLRSLQAEKARIKALLRRDAS